MSYQEDKRRRQYFPLAVNWAHGDMGTKLKRKFGRDGLLVWVCYLTACKTNWIQGQFTYANEPDGWTKLGLYGYEPKFSLASYFTYTGQLKQTSRRRSGDLVDVICTRWGDWNKEFKRDRDASQKSRKRDTITTTLGRLPGDVLAILGATEVEVDVEVDYVRAALWESAWKWACANTHLDATKLGKSLTREYPELDDLTAVRLAQEAKERAA